MYRIVTSAVVEKCLSRMPAAQRGEAERLLLGAQRGGWGARDERGRPYLDLGDYRLLGTLDEEAGVLRLEEVLAVGRVSRLSIE